MVNTAVKRSLRELFNKRVKLQVHPRKRYLFEDGDTLLKICSETWDLKELKYVAKDSKTCQLMLAMNRLKMQMLLTYI